MTWTHKFLACFTVFAQCFCADSCAYSVIIKAGWKGSVFDEYVYVRVEGYGKERILLGTKSDMRLLSTMAGTVYWNTNNITMCLLKNSYWFLPLLPKVIVNLLWACIQHKTKIQTNKQTKILCQIVVFLSLSVVYGCRTFTALLAYEKRMPHVTLGKLNNANIRHTQIAKTRKFTCRASKRRCVLFAAVWREPGVIIRRVLFAAGWREPGVVCYHII